MLISWNAVHLTTARLKWAPFVFSSEDHNVLFTSCFYRFLFWEARCRWVKAFENLPLITQYLLHKNEIKRLSIKIIRVEIAKGNRIENQIRKAKSKPRFSPWRQKTVETQHLIKQMVPGEGFYLKKIANKLTSVCAVLESFVWSTTTTEFQQWSVFRSNVFNKRPSSYHFFQIKYLT